MPWRALPQAQPLRLHINPGTRGDPFFDLGFRPIVVWKEAAGKAGIGIPAPYSAAWEMASLIHFLLSALVRLIGD